MPAILRTTALLGCLICTRFFASCQESPEGRRQGFDDLSPILMDVDGDGHDDTFVPRTFVKKVSYPWKYDKKFEVTEEHFITFDLQLSTGRRHKSVFTYRYGFALTNEKESSWVDYWVFALIPPDHQVPGKIEVFFYSGDDSSDEMIKLKFKNGKFRIVSRKQPFSVE